MKKLMAFALALVIMTVLAIPAIAATSGVTTVTYTVEDTYTLTVPETLVVGGEAGVLEVSAYNIVAEKMVTVEADSTWKFDGVDAEDAFKLQINGSEADTVDFTKNGTASVKVVAGAGLPTAAGKYTGSITFTGAIVAALQ